MSEILQGAIDLHVHAGPSVARREVDAAEMLKEAIDYGYAAFVVKDHYFPTMMSAQLIEKHLGEAKIKVFGGIALNNSVGGINLKAVDAAYNMGAKIVYMPTVSANQHIEGHKGHHFPGAGAVKGVEEEPIIYVDSDGKLNRKVEQVLDYMAQRPDLVLSTGHGSVKEIDVLISTALAAGITKVVVNHPFYLIGANMDQIIKWGKMGAYIELNAGVFQPSKFGVVPIEIAAQIIEYVGIERIVIDSDYGQFGNGSPVKGLLFFIERLMSEGGITNQQINVMVKENPAKLLGLL